jgi:transposase
MSNDVVKGTKALGPVWAGSERSGGERSEPERSGDPAQTAACPAGRVDRNLEVLERPVRRRFTAEYKERMVREAEGCTQSGQIGSLLRREGLYSSLLDKWRSKLAQGGRAALVEAKRGRKPKRTPVEVENEALRKQNARLERRLKQAETILEIQKKVSEILGVPLARIDESEGDD